jgi:hypothetical protein
MDDPKNGPRKNLQNRRENMNKVSVIILGLLMTQAAFADGYELFSMNVSTNIAKCTSDAFGVNSCDGESGTSQDVSIPLDSCFELPQFSTCSGTLQVSDARDGYSFAGSINVTKTIQRSLGQNSMHPAQAGSVQYQISAVISPGWTTKAPQPINVTLGQVGSLTDTISFPGEEFVITNSNPVISYHPTMSLAPSTSMPTLKK